MKKRNKRKLTPDQLRAALQHQDGISRYFILDENGNEQPVEFYVWAEWFETADRRICQDMEEGAEGVRSEIRVSTVFLGIDHSFGEGPPLLYETMIFGGPLDGQCRRYTTREEAIIGHQEMCAAVNRALHG